MEIVLITGHLIQRLGESSSVRFLLVLTKGTISWVRMESAAILMRSMRSSELKSPLSPAPLILRPRVAVDAPTDILQTHVMSSSRGTFVDKDGNKLGGFGFNNVTFQAQIGYPLIAQLQAGQEINNKFVAHATFDKMGGGDLVVNNLDAGISHPYHLHGKPFFLVARGAGNLTAEQWENMRSDTAQTQNPLRRDVLEITGGSWAVLREQGSLTLI